MSAARQLRRRGEAGTVLLLVVFMAAAMLIAALVSLPRLVTQGRRQKETEMAWRGEQYVRAIRLYYRKYGRFPRSVEDFSKNPGNLHFLRKEYKDPMNEGDGSWRYIYVGPGGQVIGSLTRKLPIGLIPLQAGVPGAPGTQPATGQTNLFGGQSATTQPATPTPPATAAQVQPPGQQPATGDAPPVNPGDATDTPLPPAPEAPKQADQGASTTDGAVFGGQLIGIGSKVDRKSVRFYKGYGKYREWEFIWDPAEEAAAAGGLVPQAPGSLLPGATPPVTTPPIVTPPVNPNNPPQ